MLSSSQLKQAFDSYDKDKSGALDIDEVVKLAMSLGAKANKKEIEELFKSIDVNHDSKLSFEEFLAWYRVGKHSKLTKVLKYQMEVQRGISKAAAKIKDSGSGNE